MAHINTTGQHIPLWLTADAPSVGWALNTAQYPHQEGSFFGNIFVSPPKAYYCDGKDFAVGVVAGRIGSTQVGAPYQNPFTTSKYLVGYSPLCVNSCTIADNPNRASGYKACLGFNHVMTVWRN
jgi:hypothetical protein